MRNVIFDWSGTISDDFGVLYEIAMELFEEHGVKRVTREEFLRSYTLPYMASINRFFNVSKEEWDSKFGKRWHEKGFPKPFPDALETLEFLKEKGVRMCVFTSHPEDFIMREMKLYFNKKNFFISVYAGVYDKRKVIHELVKALNFIPKETLFVGDTVHDIETGKLAGVKTAAVLSGYNSEEDLRMANPDFFLEKISDLKGLF